MQNLKPLSRPNNKNFGKNYLKAIKTSIEHFITIEKDLDKLYSEKVSANDNFFEPLHINKINYIAILALESLGLLQPTQSQIDEIEKLILISNQKQFCNEISLEEIKT